MTAYGRMLPAIMCVVGWSHKPSSYETRHRCSSDTGTRRATRAGLMVVSRPHRHRSAEQVRQTRCGAVPPALGLPSGRHGVDVGGSELRDSTVYCWSGYLAIVGCDLSFRSGRDHVAWTAPDYPPQPVAFADADRSIWLNNMKEPSRAVTASRRSSLRAWPFLSQHVRLRTRWS